jgi:hypothetical protein
MQGTVDVRLTKEELDLIIRESKIKADKVRSQSQEIFNSLVNNNDKEWLERFDRFLLDGKKGRYMGIEPKLTENIKKELWKDGWILTDPYWKWNFKAITPMIKTCFFDKGISVGMVKLSFSREGINRRFSELYGGIPAKFISIFNHEGEQYVKALIANGIMDKIGRKTDFPYTQYEYKQWRGIPKGVICDLLGVMRTFGNKPSNV